MTRVERIDYFMNLKMMIKTSIDPGKISCIYIKNYPGYFLWLSLNICHIVTDCYLSLKKRRDSYKRTKTGRFCYLAVCQIYLILSTCLGNGSLQVTPYSLYRVVLSDFPFVTLQKKKSDTIGVTLFLRAFYNFIRFFSLFHLTKIR